MVKTRYRQTCNDLGKHRMVGATQGDYTVFVVRGGAIEKGLSHIKRWCFARRDFLKRVKRNPQNSAGVVLVIKCSDHLGISDVVVVVKSKRRDHSILGTNIQSSIGAKGSRSRIVNVARKCPNIEFYRHLIIVNYDHGQRTDDPVVIRIRTGRIQLNRYALLTFFVSVVDRGDRDCLRVLIVVWRESECGRGEVNFIAGRNLNGNVAGGRLSQSNGNRIGVSAFSDDRTPIGR